VNPLAALPRAAAESCAGEEGQERAREDQVSVSVSFPLAAS
jgi:hypothetical protein